MTRFRYILIGIVGICGLLLIASISGVTQLLNPRQGDSTTILDEEIDAIDTYEEKGLFVDPVDQIDRKQSIDPLTDASQKIYGMHIPNYDESGNEVSVVRSKYTALFENKIYKIREPFIEFNNLTNSNPWVAPKKIVITAKEGMMNVETNEGALSGDVVVHLDENTRVNTSGLTYLPAKRRIFTDDEVIIANDKMIIKGREFEIGLADSKAFIKRDAEMRLAGIAGSIFDISDEKGTLDHKSKDFMGPLSADLQTANKDTAYSSVKCAGQLVFDKNINTITFHDNVQVYMGEMTVFADLLKIRFSSNTKEIEQIIATGNALAMDETNIAKGDTLIWDSTTNITTLEDLNGAELLNNTMFVNSNKIRLYNNNRWVEAPSVGTLLTISDMNTLNNSDSTSTKDSRPDHIPAKNQGHDSDKETIKQREKEYYYQRYLDTRSRFQYGQSEDTDNDDEAMVKVIWKGQMLFKNDEHSATFKKDVAIIRPGSQMNCEELIISFDDHNAIKTLTALQNIHIVEQKDGYDSEAMADSITWEVNNGPVELKGEPHAQIKTKNKQLSSTKILISDNGSTIRAEEKGNLSIIPEKISGKNKKSSDGIYLEWQGKMDFNRLRKKATFYENIQAFKQGLNVRCDQLAVFFDEAENLERIVALENVYISSEIASNLEGFGTMLTWEIKDNIAVLTGDPLAEIRKEGSRTLSKKVYFDINTRQVRWEGGSHWEIFKEDIKALKSAQVGGQ